MFRRKLACSFCRRNEAEVAKLVAGSRAYICDRCATEVVRIMADSDDTKTSQPVAPQASPRPMQRLLQRLRRGGSSGTSEYQIATNPEPSAV